MPKLPETQQRRSHGGQHLIREANGTTWALPERRPCHDTGRLASKRAAKRAGCGSETYTAFRSASADAKGGTEKLLNEDPASGLLEVVT